MNICTFLLLKLIKPSLQLQTSYFIQEDWLAAARSLNLRAGTGTVHSANSFEFWSESALCTVNIITVVESDVLHSLGLSQTSDGCSHLLLFDIRLKCKVQST